MNDVREGAVCGVDGCSTQDTPSSTGAELTARQTLSLEVISDAICPWCWVAKHRLDRAIAALGPETAVQVTWRPFELNPDMPKDGLDRRAYRLHKFGSWERSQALDGQVAPSTSASSPMRRMLRAAFTSRSCSVPQSSQAHALLDKSAIPFGREGGRHPHSEQTWVVRYSETSSVLPPFLMDLYESMRLKSDHPASSTLFAMVV